MFDKIISAAAAKHMPEFNPNYAWHVSFQYEEDNQPHPTEIIHSSPKEALEHMIRLWNDTRTLIYVSVARRNA